jgi:hypothetical protein
MAKVGGYEGEAFIVEGIGTCFLILVETKQPDIHITGTF